MAQWAEEDEAVKTLKTRLMREARRRRGWTQFELSRRVGCSESQITKIETGRITPEPWLKAAIARELDLATWEIEASVSSASHWNPPYESAHPGNKPRTTGQYPRGHVGQEGTSQPAEDDHANGRELATTGDHPLREDRQDRSVLLGRRAGPSQNPLPSLPTDDDQVGKHADLAQPSPKTSTKLPSKEGGFL